MMVEPIFSSNLKATRDSRPINDDPPPDDSPRTSETEEGGEPEDRGKHLWSGAGTPDRQLSERSHDSDDSTFHQEAESFKSMVENAMLASGNARASPIRFGNLPDESEAEAETHEDRDRAQAKSDLRQN